ncbi:MAG TPA: PKD domain-containing protein, partial [Pyrinomonadaceae bacterium]
TGRAWRTVPNGAIRGNRNVVRKISFPAIETNKIRVVVLNALGGESRITEIEAWHVNDLPQAKIAIAGKRNTKNITKDSAVNFVTEVFDLDGKIHEYELDFGDNSNTYEWEFDHQKPGNKPKLTHRHVYEKEGTYAVKLRLVDDSNEANETTMVVNVVAPPVRPEPTANPTARNRSRQRRN